MCNTKNNQRTCRTCRYLIDDHPYNCLQASSIRESIELQRNALAYMNCEKWAEFLHYPDERIELNE